MTSISPELEARARQSLGASDDAIHALVESLVISRHRGGGVLVDVGCGTGALCHRLERHFTRCVGVDAVRYDGLGAGVEFVRQDLDRPMTQVTDGCASVVTAVETIEHLENPWAFGRELARIAAPGGWVVVTTPNQLSVLSKLTLVLKNMFNAFQDGSYPAHRTALLEVDLRRVVGEAGLEDPEVRYTRRGRVPFTGLHYPGGAGVVFPRACSDNVAIAAQKPRGAP